MGRKIAETPIPEASALELLTVLLQQHEEFGQRLASILRRAESEIEDLKAEAQACAAALDEARAELVELRATLETEKAKRATAEARIGKLDSHVRRMKLSCDEALSEDDQTPPTSEPGGDVDVSQDEATSTSTPLSEALGLTAPVLAALDALTAMDGAASPEEMLRNLLFRELRKTGLMPEAGSEGNEVSVCGEETPTIRC